MADLMSLSPLREGRITGSRIGAVLGVNRYQSRAKVLAEMIAQAQGLPADFQGNEATEYGSLHERDALTAYEQERGVMVWGGQDFLIHPLHPFLASTPDGYVDEDGMVEAKCPFSAKYEHISQKPEYEAQIRLQLECAGRAWCDFIVWRPSGLAISRVEHDPEWLPSVMPKLEKFMADYRAALALAVAA